jgi:hypothetical protein
MQFSLQAASPETFGYSPILGGEPEGNRPIRRPSCRWEDNIIIDVLEMRWIADGWIHLAQDRDQWRALVNTIMNLLVLFKKKKTVNGLTSRVTTGFLRTLFHVGR